MAIPLIPGRGYAVTFDSGVHSYAQSTRIDLHNKHNTCRFDWTDALCDKNEETEIAILLTINHLYSQDRTQQPLYNMNHRLVKCISLLQFRRWLARRHLLDFQLTSTGFAEKLANCFIRKQLIVPSVFYWRYIGRIDFIAVSGSNMWIVKNLLISNQPKWHTI